MTETEPTPSVKGTGLLFRKEASLLDTPAINKSAKSSFRSGLLVEQAHNKDDMVHRHKVAREDPLAHFIVYKLAENALDDGFKFIDKDGEEIMLDCQKELKKINFKTIFTQALIASRWAGWTWLHTVHNKNHRQEVKGGGIAKLDYFTPLDSVVKTFDKVTGEPTEIEVKILQGIGPYATIEVPITISVKDLILFRGIPYDRSYKADPVTYSIWDDMTAIRQIIDSTVTFDSMVGKGMFVDYLKKMPDEAGKSTLEDDISSMSTARSIGINTEVHEKIEWVGSNAAGVSFEPDVRMCLQRVAAGAGVPVDSLTGVSAGAITGSETNIKTLFQTINSIQQSVNPYIRELVTRMGYGDDYDIEWNVRFAHDEEQKARIRQTVAQAGLMEQTLKEKLEGTYRNPNDADVTMKMQTPEEKDQTRNPEGNQL